MSKSLPIYLIPPKTTYGHMYAYMILYMLMKRTALFLKEQQLA